MWDYLLLYLFIYLFIYSPTLKYVIIRNNYVIDQRPKIPESNFANR